MRWTLTWLLTMLVGFGLMLGAYRWARGQVRPNRWANGVLCISGGPPMDPDAAAEFQPVAAVNEAVGVIALMKMAAVP